MCRTRHGKPPHRTSIHLLLLAVFLIAFTGCRKKKVALSTPAPVVAPTVETGMASWYGHPYHGRRTANGEVYDMEKMTAAHRTRPFDSWVRVYNLDNGRTVDVRINDRGPFVDGRIIDLSRAAARKIEMLGPGTAKVEVRTIARPTMSEEQTPPSAARFAVQVGAFLDIDNAERMQMKLAEQFGNVRVIERDGDPPMWRVVIGEFLDRGSAGEMAERVRTEFGPSFVVRLDDEIPRNSDGEDQGNPSEPPQTP